MNAELKSFTTPDNKYTWKLPSNWGAFDDGDEGTYAFVNMNSWTGTLRITPMTLPGNAELYKDKAAKFIEEEIQQNKGAVKIRLGDYECAYYTIDTFQDDAESLIHYWTAGLDDTVFMCSFTVKNEEDPDQSEADIESIRQIISSITINR